jgi:hypothetical protein
MRFTTSIAICDKCERILRVFHGTVCYANFKHVCTSWDNGHVCYPSCGKVEIVKNDQNSTFVVKQYSKYPTRE